MALALRTGSSSTIMTSFEGEDVAGREDGLEATLDQEVEDML